MGFRWLGFLLCFMILKKGSPVSCSGHRQVSAYELENVTVYSELRQTLGYSSDALGLHRGVFCTAIGRKKSWLGFSDAFFRQTWGQAL